MKLGVGSLLSLLLMGAAKADLMPQNSEKSKTGRSAVTLAESLRIAAHQQSKTGSDAADTQAETAREAYKPSASEPEESWSSGCSPADQENKATASTEEDCIPYGSPQGEGE
jgi:hypothetical protein